MMRPREPLEEYELPTWKGQYLPFDRLKWQLKAAVAGRGSAEAAEAVDLWERAVEDEAKLVGERVDAGLASLREQLSELSKLAAPLPAEVSTAGVQRNPAAAIVAGDSVLVDGEGLLELRVLEGLGRVTEGVQMLRGFAEVNHAALFKLTKRRDHELGGSDGLRNFLPRLVEASGLDNMRRFDELQQDVQNTFMQSPVCEGLDASPEVARMAAGLSSSVHVRSRTVAAERALFFILGILLMLVIAIIIILEVPVTIEPLTFSPSYFMSSFSVFRVCMSAVLILWGLGVVTRTCEGWGINHMFIMNIDPRKVVRPTYFFGMAVMLSAMWISVIAAYISDYKWELITPWQGGGTDVFNDRSSIHFLFYPLGLLIFTVLLLLLPSTSCRCANRLGVLYSVGRVAAAPLFAVSFCDNIAGDVLTSLTKPFQDIPAAYCYLVSSHPQTVAEVKKFKDHGNLCSPFINHVFMPIIAGLPLYFRLMQCARRYHDSGETKHLYNLGKYASSIVVVVIGAATDSTALLVVFSVFSTLYSFTWDIYMDWGLGRRELATIAAFGRSAEADDRAPRPSATRPSAARPSAMRPSLMGVRPSAVGQTDWLLSIADIQENESGPSAHEDGRRLLFPSFVYPLAALFDFVARCSWVLNLVPITILTTNIPDREVYKTVMTALEIARRSVWSVLRIEHEQVANAGKFRALLWVPHKVGAMPVTGK